MFNFCDTRVYLNGQSIRTQLSVNQYSTLLDLEQIRTDAFVQVRIKKDRRKRYISGRDVQCLFFDRLGDEINGTGIKGTGFGLKSVRRARFAH